MRGWMVVGFLDELRSPLTAVTVGDRRLVLARSGTVVRAFDADCPHRGANLAVGGLLKEEHIICPFHGYSIGLSQRSEFNLWVREYELMEVRGTLFLRLSDDFENGLTARLDALAKSHTVIPGFQLKIHARPELIIENAFDRRHFTSVHGVEGEPFRVGRDSAGAATIEGELRVPAVGPFASTGEGQPARLKFFGVAVSPYLAIVTLSGATTYTIVTGARPDASDGCVVTISLALPYDSWGRTPSPQTYAYLIQHSLRGLEDDRAIWENVSLTSVHHFARDDEPVEDFHRFCLPFLEHPLDNGPSSAL